MLLSSFTMSPPIAILGAGPAGLMLARLLELDGISYTVFERDIAPSSVATGGSLDIHPEDGQLALREAGLFEEFQKLARYEAQSTKGMDSQGDLFWDKSYTGQTDRPEIDRPQLRQILLDSVPAHRIHWDSKVDKIVKSPSGTMEIHLHSGAVHKGFFLVVGADGAWSKVRSLITPAVPQYSGFCHLQTTIEPGNAHYEAIRDLVGPGMLIALSKGNSVIAQQMSNGLYNVYAGIKIPEDWTKTQADLVASPGFRDWLIDTHYSGWSSQATDLIRHSEAPFRAWPLYSLPKESLNWKTVPGVALVGDAAHLCVPNGEGVNIAMYDSYCLAQEIKKHGLGNLTAAVEAYEKDMLPRGIGSIIQGEEMFKLFGAEDSPRGFKEWTASMPPEHNQ